MPYYTTPHYVNLSQVADNHIPITVPQYYGVIYNKANYFFQNDPFAKKYLNLYITGSFARKLALGTIHGSVYAQNYKANDLDFSISRKYIPISPTIEEQTVFTQEIWQCFIRLQRILVAADELKKFPIISVKNKWLNLKVGFIDFSFSYDHIDSKLLSSGHVNISLPTGAILFSDYAAYLEFLNRIINIPSIQTLLNGELTLNKANARINANKFKKIIKEDVSMQEWHDAMVELNNTTALHTRLGHLLYVADSLLDCGFNYNEATFTAIATVCKDPVKRHDISQIKVKFTLKKQADYQAYLQKITAPKDKEETHIKEEFLAANDSPSDKIATTEIKSDTNALLNNNNLNNSDTSNVTENSSKTDSPLLSSDNTNSDVPELDNDSDTSKDKPHNSDIIEISNSIDINLQATQNNNNNNASDFLIYVIKQKDKQDEIETNNIASAANHSISENRNILKQKNPITHNKPKDKIAKEKSIKQNPLALPKFSDNFDAFTEALTIFVSQCTNVADKPTQREYLRQVHQEITAAINHEHVIINRNTVAEFNAVISNNVWNNLDNISLTRAHKFVTLWKNRSNSKKAQEQSKVTEIQQEDSTATINDATGTTNVAAINDALTSATDEIAIKNTSTTNTDVTSSQVSSISTSEQDDHENLEMITRASHSPINNEVLETIPLAPHQESETASRPSSSDTPMPIVSNKVFTGFSDAAIGVIGSSLILGLVYNIYFTDLNEQEKKYQYNVLFGLTTCIVSCTTFTTLYKKFYKPLPTYIATIKTFENNNNWEIEQFTSLILSLRFAEQVSRDSLFDNNPNPQYGNHPKTQFLIKVLRIYENFARIKGQNEINLEDNCHELLKMIQQCYGSLEKAADAEYLFLAEICAIKPIHIKNDTERLRRTMNNCFVMNNEYIKQLKQLPTLHVNEIAEFYQSAFHVTVEATADAATKLCTNHQYQPHPSSASSANQQQKKKSKKHK